MIVIEHPGDWEIRPAEMLKGMRWLRKSDWVLSSVDKISAAFHNSFTGGWLHVNNLVR